MNISATSPSFADEPAASETATGETATGETATSETATSETAAGEPASGETGEPPVELAAESATELTNEPTTEPMSESESEPATDPKADPSDTPSGAPSADPSSAPTTAPATEPSARAASRFIASALVAAPTITVSKTVNLDADGETVTVTGTGFVPNAPSTSGTRPPLAGKFGGAYVVFGKFADTWKPSAGAPASARKVGSQNWVVNAADVATIGSAQGVALDENGNFSLELTVRRGFAGEPPTGNYGIYTFSGSGASYAGFETYTPVAFAPTVTVSKTTELTPVGEIVTVTGSGFSPVAPSTSGARPPLAGKFGGAYVVFGKFADTWMPSAGAPSSARKVGSQKWVVNAEDVATIGSAQGVAINADGTFTLELLVSRGFTGEPATGNYGIYTYPGSGASYAPFETYTPVSFTAASDTTLSLASVPAKPVEGGKLTLTATVSPVADGTVTFSNGSSALGVATVSASGTASIQVSSLAAGVQNFSAEFTPTNALLFAPSSTTATVTVAKKVVGAGSLTWGIKQSFRDYVSGSIAQGSVTGSGVSTSGGAFVFGQSSGGTYTPESGTGTSRYSGSVRFVGHEGLLDVQLANPVIRVDNASRATLLLNVNGGGAIEFATLNLAVAAKSTPHNAVTYAGVPAALTARGASVFSFNGSPFYSAGTALDSLTFVIGSASSTGGGTTTVARYTEKANTPDASAPATTGITIEGANGATDGTVVAGDTVTIESSGFAPNEDGILVVIYSEPVVLSSTVKADSSGTARWSGALPADLTGSHTLTLQGSVDRGVELTIAPRIATAAVNGCTVDAGEIIWGFKESFRSYISGSIANGEWTVSEGASYATPNFTWSAGAGVYDAKASTGLVAFPGAVTFTGHGGILNTTVSNPQLRFESPERAVLVVDVTGTTQAGEEVNDLGVEFVELDLAGGTLVDVVDGVVAFSEVPTVLLPDGATAFGTYEAGEAFDPITVSFALGAGCAAPIPAEPTATPTPGPADGDGSADGAGWLIFWIVLATLVVIAAIVIAMVAGAKRRRAAAEDVG